MPNPNRIRPSTLVAAIALSCAVCAMPALAQLTDISQTPLAAGDNETSAVPVRPNIMFILDDSGSMDWEYLPDHVTANSQSGNPETCKTRGGDSRRWCQEGDPPFYATQFNTIYYNPEITYAPAVKFDGTDMTKYASPWTSVRRDGFSTATASSNFINLTTGYPEMEYCNATNLNNCKRNGIDTTAPFDYRSGTPDTGRTHGYPESVLFSGTFSSSGTGSISKSGSTVTVNIPNHGLATGNEVSVISSSGTCGAAYTTSVATVTVTGTSTFTYANGTSTTGNGSRGCSVSYLPQIFSGNMAASGTNSVVKSGSTVTMNITNHGLSTGDLVSISNGSSTCGAAYTTNSAIVTVTGTNTFTYPNGTSTTANTSRNCRVSRYPYQYASQITGRPHYYTIAPKEYCSDDNLVNCGATQTTTNAIPAPVRYCSTTTDADSASVVTGLSSGLPRCRAKFDDTYMYPRYGRFNRVDINPAKTTYTGGPLRADCAARPTCTYAEEMTNFANWYAYYRTRMQTMKTASGRAFKNIGDNYRVGFITINPGSSVSSSKYLKIDDFTASHKEAWYKKFYDQSPSGGTPLRQALARAGWIYAGKLGNSSTSGDNLTRGIPAIDDPVQYSCQQNFAILTSDGYWNGSAGRTISGTLGGTIGNQDNDLGIAPRPLWDGGSTGTTVATKTDKTYSRVGYSNTGCTTVTTGTAVRWKLTTTTTVTTTTTIYSGTAPISQTTSTPTVTTSTGACVTPAPAIPANTSTTTTSSSGASGGSTDSLSDVAMYYYKTDLRPNGATGALGIDVSENNVPVSDKDNAPYQHMTTFTLGMVDGQMTYRPDYETANTGDFNNIKTGANNQCSWVTGTCQWPIPTENSQSALDDMWHAAANGRGSFYLAQDPNALSRGLSSALTGVSIRTAAAAASATTSPNVTQTDRGIFSSTYSTVEWAGEVIKQDINISTGETEEAVLWSAQEKLDARVGESSDTRNIHLFDSSTATKLKPFLWANLTTTEQGWFSNKCTPLGTMSQCNLLNFLIANVGQNMVNYLRGQTQHENGIYRNRAHALGDTVNATPAFMAEPRASYGDVGYVDFKAANASRQSALFVAANDGMLHALNADSGEEMWAFIPRMGMQELYKLADENYGTNHRYFVDGSPQTGDVYTGSAWKTILVGGLNNGGRGYFAIDVTDPTAPKGLWEFCHDATLCAISDTDLGLSYGNPIITKRPSDGKWVVLVTSGYNNVSPGTGRAFLYVLDAMTGAILNKVDTGAGTAGAPAGLAKISVWADNAAVDNTGRYVYGGDMHGNLWRFNLQTSPIGVLKIGVLTDDNNRPQSVTTRPELGLVQGHRVAFVGTGRYLGITDLQDPATLSPPLNDAFQQSIYAIKDKDIAYGDIRDNANLVEQVLTAIDDLNRGISANAVDWGTNNGWYVDFNPGNSSPGERTVLEPRLLLGTLAVTTNVPKSDACTVAGESWSYEFNYQTGYQVSTSPNQVVGRKLGSAFTVGVVYVRLPSGQIKAIATDASGKKTTFGVNIGGSGASGKRTSWREMIQ